MTELHPPAAPTSERRPRLVGVALICVALALFACVDTSAKWLNGHLPTIEVVWARYASAFAVTLFAVNPWTTPGLLRTQRPLLQLGRSGLLLMSTLLNFIALKELRLDQVTSIVFTAPFFVAALAGPMLGEWIGWRRWLAIFIGFLGVLVVVRPGFGGIHWYAFLSLGGAVSYALYNLTTRMLARHDSTQTTMFYSNLVGLAATTIPLPWLWTPPSGAGVATMMVLIGTFAMAGHTLLIMAHRLAPTSTLAPFIYTQIIWMPLFGYLVFGDVPDRWTLAGATVVIGSGLYLLHRERRA